jgi:hypothetical protein
MPLVWWLYADQCAQESVDLVFCGNVWVCVCLLLSKSWKKSSTPAHEDMPDILSKNTSQKNTNTEYISVGKVTIGSPTTHLSSRWSS